MAAAKAASMSGHLVSFHKPGNFLETRLSLPPGADPTGLGGLSLGYSHGELKVYWTKFVGMEGCIDWNLQSLIKNIRTCIQTKTITSEIGSIVQGVSNQLMPGLQWDISGAGYLNTHVFLRPHTEGTRAGFAMCISRDFQLSQLSTGTASLFENLASVAPVYSLAHRSVGESTPVGDISASLLLIFKASGTVSVMIDIEFLFNAPFSKSAGEMVGRGFVSSSKKKNNHNNTKNSGDDSDSSIGSVSVSGSGQGLMFPSLPIATAAGIVGLLGLSAVAFPGAVSRM